MNDVVKSQKARVYFNGDFIYIETTSGYRLILSDPKGQQYFLAPNSSDEVLGIAVLDALSHSRFVVAAPREGIDFPSDIEFDDDLYDYSKRVERYAAWVRMLMARYRYKTKRMLFKNMGHCDVSSAEGIIKIEPMRHVKLEAWQGMDPTNSVELVANSAPGEIGAGLRLALSRCTE